MPNRLLHAVEIPSDAQIQSGSQRRKQLSKQGLLQSDVSATETIAPKPGQETVRGQFRGKFAPLLANMVEELFDSGIEVVPYTARGIDDAVDGYYAPENVNTDRPDAREDRIQSFDGILSPKGTIASHWRAVRTNSTSATNPFANSGSSEIGLTDRAKKVQWFDDVGGSLVDATVQRSVEGEHDSINIYDVGEPSFSDPVLIYTLPYHLEWRTDCRVWDTYDRPKRYHGRRVDGATIGSSTVGSATVGGYGVNVASQWQRVYLTTHDWRGDIILETDRLRLEVDQPDESLSAYRWDDDDRIYAAVQLGSSPWRLWDIDLLHVDLARIKAQMEFENTNNGSRHNLNATLQRGLDDVLWTVPDNGSSPPQSLKDRLDPIARDDGTVVISDGDVIKRGDVDR